MDIFVHLVVLGISALITWYFAGLLIESINNVAKRFKQSGFTVAFFVLGFLTSISELSVMANSLLNGTPAISAGNLVGASFTILLGIIPVLAIVGGGIKLTNTLHKRNLGLALLVVAIPVLLLVDGDLTRTEGVVCIMAYATLAYFVRSQRQASLPEVIEEVEEDLVQRRRATTTDLLKITIGGIFIFGAGHMLVEETVFFSNLINIPTSLFGLIILSIGTNIPEIVIAIRSVLKKRTDIAFGNYLGSGVANTLVFGVLALSSGRILVEQSEFIISAVLMTVGLIGFYIAAQSGNKISRKEGMLLVCAYALFLIIQLMNLVRIAVD